MEFIDFIAGLWQEEELQRAHKRRMNYGSPEPDTQDSPAGDMMQKKLAIPLLALALCGGAQAQSNEELKAMLDQALKTIQDLQGRVKVLEQSKLAPTAPAVPPAAAASAAPTWGAPVVSAATRAEDASTPDADKARLEIYGQVMLDCLAVPDPRCADASSCLRRTRFRAMT